MPVGVLSRLNAEERRELVGRLLETQAGRCYICQQEIDLQLHYDHLEIDHIKPLSSGGPDKETNYAVTHGACNHKKLSSHLFVARQLARFQRITDECAHTKHRGPTLEELLAISDGGRGRLDFEARDGYVKYSLPSVDDQEVRTVALMTDKLSKIRSFFAELPLAVLYHDHRINPRAIGPNLRGLLEEFHAGRPQLHVSLGWVQSTGDEKGKVHIFDGQHKAAAQILLGAKTLPVRVFLDPDLNLLLETNTNAGSKLRQVAFDKSSLRNLGSKLYWERIGQYQRDHGRAEDDLDFSEEDLCTHFKGQTREIKRYIADDVRHRVTLDPDNRLMPYVEFAGKSTEKPLSYSTLEKTFFSQYICQQPLSTPIGTEPDPRETERRQLVALMNVFAEEVFDGRYDFDIGTHRIETKVADGGEVPPMHLAAVRLSREEVMQAVVALTRDVLENYLAYQGIPVALYKERLLHHEFADQAWHNVRNFVRSLRDLPCWSNPALATTVFGGKPNYEYWRVVFATGKTPQNVQVLAKPVNLIEMVQSEG